MKYSDYMRQNSYLLAPPQQAAAPPKKTNGAAAPPAPPPPQAKPSEPAVFIPQELLGVQAYLLWEQAGKPDGADFGDKARQVLEGRIRGGASLADLERELLTPPEQPQQRAAEPKQKRKEQQQQQQQEAPPPPPPAPAAVVVGQSMGQRARNALDLIHRTVGAAVMQAKPKYLRTPMTALVEAAQANTGVHWFRVRAQGTALAGGMGRHTSTLPCRPARKCMEWPLPSPPAPPHPFRCAACPYCLLQLYNVGDKREMLATVHLDDPNNPNESQVTVSLTTTLSDGALQATRLPGAG